MTERLVNMGETTLAEDLDDSELVVTVTDGSVFPTTGDFRLAVDDELMLVTARSTNDLTVVRGIEGTTPASHADGTACACVITNAGLRRLINQSPASRVFNYQNFR
jgi:hypothetical protein